MSMASEMQSVWSLSSVGQLFKLFPAALPSFTIILVCGPAVSGRLLGSFSRGCDLGENEASSSEYVRYLRFWGVIGGLGRF